MITLTHETQLDWDNHSSLISPAGEIPWCMAPQENVEGINSSEKSALLPHGLYEKILSGGDFSGNKVGEVYSLFNGETFSPWAEMTMDNRLFAGDMGPGTIFGRGLAIVLPTGMVGDSELKDALKLLSYRGEVAGEIDETGKIVGFHLGSPIGAFRLYSYLFRGDRADKCLRFILGKEKTLIPEEKISLSTFVTPYGFPLEKTEPLQVPSDFRQNFFVHSPGGVVTVSGNTMKEARVRMKKILRILEKKNGRIQYRIDYWFSTGLSPLAFSLYREL